MNKILFLSLFLYHFLIVYSSTHCRNQGKWLILSIPKQEIIKLLPNGAIFDDHPFLKKPYSIPNDHHPIYLEFNYVKDCWAYYIFPAPNMHEFKIEIPFIKFNNNKSAIYKPLVLVDNWINAQGSKFVYGLSTFYVNYNGIDENTFKMNWEKNEINGFFDGFSDWAYNSDEIINFRDVFIYINEYLWYTNELNFDINNIYCASNEFLWNKNNMRIRKIGNVNGNIKFENFNINFDAKNLIYASEVDVDLHISGKKKCFN